VEQLRPILREYWGYDSFRPLQAEAMQCVLGHRDSVVVLPTGGGKSLCFQAPALAMPGLAVVVSPLISLMKDQVDALTECGAPAACLNSTLSADERREIGTRIRKGELKLLYVAPERLVLPGMMSFLTTVDLAFVAIDEAHCISEWGHDFRPEYRALSVLRETFPKLAVHAYTATATPRVREDIARELHLRDPAVLVGSFDRPNLVYRIQQRSSLLNQVREVIDRHKDESGVIYCIRRADVESLSESLNAAGCKALPYHAGLSDADRHRNQEAFIQEKVDVIVATVAFGMGIDKSNVRFVIHAAAPKSLENYQQESGRAGRDNLEAECCMFYSAGDFITWKKMQSDLEPQAHEVAMKTLAGIELFCSGALCRHRAIVEYFGQPFETENCGACDVCLAEVELIPDALVTGQKILSCVARLQQRFGTDYTAQVLSGSKEQRILANGHDQLSTYGLLSTAGKSHVRQWIDQLLAQGYLQKGGEFGSLQITPDGRKLLRGEVTPRLVRPAVAAKAKRESKTEKTSWEGVDRALFEVLRKLRREIADEREIPTWMVFSDASLRDMCRLRPQTPADFLEVHGVGQKKSAEFGTTFMAAIREFGEGEEGASAP
jgi:ATP-dependent DNA helicase RecQ